MAERTPAQLLRDAAGLIEAASRSLNTKHTKCRECGIVHYEDLVQGRVHSRLDDLPKKLRGHAQALENPTAARRREGDE